MCRALKNKRKKLQNKDEAFCYYSFCVNSIEDCRHFVHLKRSCQEDDFKGGGAKGHVNVVAIASFSGMEFHTCEHAIK